jgi:type III secretion system YscD/HrpQ family protein
MSPTDMDAVLDVVDEALDEAGLAARASYAAETDDAGQGGIIEVLDLLEDDGQGDPAHDQAEAGAAEPPPLPQRVLELRILSGMHAGARAPLQGEDYLLGTLDDCDFVLEDAGVQPHHARLSRCTATDEGCGESGWQLDWVAHEGGEALLAPTRLVHGTAVPIGPIVVAVDEPGAPWPTLEQLVLVPHAPALEPSLPAPPDTPAQHHAWRWRLRAMSPRRVVLVLAAATLGLSGAAAALVAWPIALGGGAAAAAVPASAAAPAPLAPDPAQRQAIEAVLASRGLAGRARIEPVGANWLVRAPVMSDMDGEALATALSRLQPRPVLRLPTEQELRDEVAEALPRLAGEHAGAIKLRAMGPGRLRLEGRLANAGQRDKLLGSVAEAFPQAVWDNAVLTTEEAAAELLAELRTRGWQASGEWKNDALQVQVTLQQRDVPQWEQTLVAVNRTHAVPLHATMAFAQSAPTPPPAPRGVESRLPFQLRGVVGGDMPYVLLSDGDKLSQGGVWKGWRLASISASQVVFENGAQRAVLTR